MSARDILQADIDTRVVAMICITFLAGLALVMMDSDHTAIFTHAVAALGGLGMGKALNK